MRKLIILCALLSGCVVEATEDEEKSKCDPVGTWEVTLTTGSGDCFDRGITDTTEIKFTEYDRASLDEERCKFEQSGPWALEETEDFYGLEGTLLVKVSFTGDRAAGIATLEGDLLDSGEFVDTCNQRYSLEGKRR